MLGKSSAAAMCLASCAPLEKPALRLDETFGWGWNRKPFLHTLKRLIAVAVLTLL
jgi:hypothetical protein